MTNRYPHIFSPLKVRNVTYKNRIFSAPLTPHLLQAHEEYPTERFIAHYREKARGGSASITVGAQNMDVLWAPSDHVHLNANIFDEQYHRIWQQLTAAIHFFDAKASLELLAFDYHEKDSDGNLIVYDVDALTSEQISHIADLYAQAAEGALRSGFDAVFLHGGHGVLLSRFLSPLFNHRTDSYGGSAKNRARLSTLILDRIREKVEDRLIIEYRVNGSDLALEGGFAIEDCIEFLRIVEDKIDIAHVSAGNFHVPGTPSVMMPSEFEKPGVNVHFAAAVKASGTKLPVLTLGAFQDPGHIERILEKGEADIVSMARGTLADPNLVNKALAGDESDIIPCLRCFYCLDYNNAPEFNCSVNPEIGRESALRGLVAAPQKKKKVIVIGGGPAGLTAAIELRKRGHEVILFEKENKLGGKLWFAESVSFKKGVFLFMQYLIRSAEKWGMDFRLNREAAPKLVNDENPDAVIAAIGADAIKPDISGVDRKNVIFAEQAFKNSVFGNTVAVIGGDQIGSEVALYLAQQGKNVSILAPEAELAIDALKIPREGLLKRVEGIVNHETGVTGIEIGENQVVFRDSKRRVRTIAANSVVLSAGFQPRNELAELFRGTHAEFRVVGDSLRIGRLHNATRTAFDAANQI